MDAACFGADGDGSSLECPQAVGSTDVDRLRGLNGTSGGKMSGLQGRFGEGALVAFTRPLRYYKNLTLSTFYPGKVAGEEETGKAKVSTL